MPALPGTRRPVSRVISMRMGEKQMERLGRLARQLGRTPSETSALLVKESLRRSEFAYLDFRNSPVGRQAYIQGTGLAVWEAVLVAKGYEMDPKRTAEHLQWPLPRVQAALTYAAAFPEEIAAALRDNEALDFEAVARMLPQASRFVVHEEAGGTAS
jgi:uncharacterized protein (DUF433 family)